MFNFKNAYQRYRVARFYGLPTKLCLKVFFLGNGNPYDNLKKLVEERKSNDS